MYDVGMRCEKGVGFYFFESQRDGFLTKGTADLFQRVQLRCRGVLNQINIGEAALHPYTLVQCVL